MKVFIENEAGSEEKNIFNEKTLEYIRTTKVSAAYPFPYGFVLNTTSGDGDNLDCFVLTTRSLKNREIVEVKAKAMFEQLEDGVADHKILATFEGEEIIVDERIQEILRKFTSEVFSHKRDKTISVGRFLGIDEAEKLINDCKL